MSNDVGGINPWNPFKLGIAGNSPSANATGGSDTTSIFNAIDALETQKSTYEAQKAQVAENTQQQQEDAQQIADSLKNALSQYEASVSAADAAQSAADVAQSSANSARANANSLRANANALRANANTLMSGINSASPEEAAQARASAQAAKNAADAAEAAAAAAEAAATEAEAQAEQLQTAANEAVQNSEIYKQAYEDAYTAASEVDESDNSDSDSELAEIQDAISECESRIGQYNEQLQQIEEKQAQQNEEQQNEFEIADDDETEISTNDDGDTISTRKLADGTEIKTVVKSDGSVENIITKNGVEIISSDFNSTEAMNINMLGEDDDSETSISFADGKISQIKNSSNDGELMINNDDNDTYISSTKANGDKAALQINDNSQIVTFASVDSSTGIKKIIDETGDIIYQDSNGNLLETLSDVKNAENEAEQEENIADLKAQTSSINLNDYYKEFNSQYDKATQFDEYKSAVSEAIKTDIMQQYGVESDSVELNAVYKKLAQDLNIQANTDKNTQDTDYASLVGEKLAEMSWDGIGDNDKISLSNISVDKATGDIAVKATKAVTLGKDGEEATLDGDEHFKVFQTEVEDGPLTGRTVMVDIGHGYDEGDTNYDSGAVSGDIKEYDLNGQYSQEIVEQLLAQGANVVLTQGKIKSNDDNYKSQPCQDIKRFVEEFGNADDNNNNLMFLSVHTNATNNQTTDAKGVCLYGANGNGELIDDLETSIKQAGIDYNYTDTEYQTRVNRAAQKYGINSNALLEIGFINNPEEVQKLQTEEYRTSLASAVVQGLCKDAEQHEIPNTLSALEEQRQQEQTQKREQAKETIASSDQLSDSAKNLLGYMDEADTAQLAETDEALEETSDDSSKTEEIQEVQDEDLTPSSNTLDLNKYYTAYKNNYANGRDDNYVSFVASEIQNDLAQIYGADSSVNSDQMKTICEQVAKNVNINLDLPENATNDDYINAVTKKIAEISWDGTAANDVIALSSTNEAAVIGVSTTAATSSQFVFSSDEIQQMYESMGLEEKGMNPKVFNMAMEGYSNLPDEEKETGIFEIFDTTQPYENERYYVIDMKNQEVIDRSQCALGDNSGLSNQEYDVSDANEDNSHATLSGFGRAVSDDETMYGNSGWTGATILEGLESTNDNMKDKHVVAHWSSLNYSYGCLAFPAQTDANGNIDEDKSTERRKELCPVGSVFFVYPPGDEDDVQEYVEMSDLVSNDGTSVTNEAEDSELVNDKKTSADFALKTSGANVKSTQLSNGKIKLTVNDTSLTINNVKSMSSDEEKIEYIAALAQQEYKNSGMLPSVTIAQLIQETGLFENSTLDSDMNNCFGMKANLGLKYIKTTAWQEKYGSENTGATRVCGTFEESGGQNYDTTSSFKVYSSILESLVDRNDFFTKTEKYGSTWNSVNYSNYVTHTSPVNSYTNPYDQIAAIWERGYATDSNYVTSIMNIIAKYDLTKYDLVDDDEEDFTAV